MVDKQAQDAANRVAVRERQILIAEVERWSLEIADGNTARARELIVGWSEFPGHTGPVTIANKPWSSVSDKYLSTIHSKAAKAWARFNSAPTYNLFDSKIDQSLKRAVRASDESRMPEIDDNGEDLPF